MLCPPEIFQCWSPLPFVKQTNLALSTFGEGLIFTLFNSYFVCRLEVVTPAISAVQPTLLLLFFFIPLDLFFSSVWILNILSLVLSWFRDSPSLLSPPGLPSLLAVPFSVLFSAMHMLSSPTVILQPYGLPVYPQTASCYPSIVQVNMSLFLCIFLFHILFGSLFVC